MYAPLVPEEEEGLERASQHFHSTRVAEEDIGHIHVIR
jgi:hypothetical protein